jgi:aminodeoxyfutalosine deaminase
MDDGAEASVSYPKIELHVHLEGTVRARTLLQIAGRNGIALPADSEEGLAGLYEFRDFAHFIDTWVLTTGALRTEQDFRQVVVDEEVFAGYCDGAQQAREQHGVEIRLTPDVTRGFPPADAELTARYAVKYRERGVVGLGLGGLEAGHVSTPETDPAAEPAWARDPPGDIAAAGPAPGAAPAEAGAAAMPGGTAPNAIRNS